MAKSVLIHTLKQNTLSVIVGDLVVIAILPKD